MMKNINTETMAHILKIAVIFFLLCWLNLIQAIAKGMPSRESRVFEKNQIYEDDTACLSAQNRAVSPTELKLRVALNVKKSFQ